MTEGWHCLHIYYRVNQQALVALDAADRAHGRAELIEISEPGRRVRSGSHAVVRRVWASSRLWTHDDGC